MKLDLTNFSYKLTDEYKNLTLSEALAKEFAIQAIENIEINARHKSEQQREKNLNDLAHMNYNGFPKVIK